MMKIIFHLNCLEQGGAERVVTNLAHQFADNGYEVIITTQWIGENEFVLQDNIRRVNLGLRENDKNKNRITQYLLRIKYLREFIKIEKPDIVIAFMKKANYRAVQATMFTNIPALISVRMDPVGHYDSIVDRIQTTLLFNRAKGIVFQTEGQRGFFSKNIQKGSKIILNPINDKYLGRDSVAERSKVIMHSGRLVDFKNQINLITAFSKIKSIYSEYTLKLFGGDSFDGTKEILEAYIKENGLEDSVKLMGASDNLAEEMESGAFYVFTSDWEGLPNALLEAMAIGMPVIATDCPCGGPGTVIRHKENGYLIPIKDVDAIVEAMEYFIQNQNEVNQYGIEARKISEIANGDTVFRQWKEYIDEICG